MERTLPIKIQKKRMIRRDSKPVRFIHSLGKLSWMGVTKASEKLMNESSASDSV